MKKDFDFDDIGKRTPYRTPDGFFEDVQRKVMERAGVKQQRKSHMKLIISTVITMAAVLIGFLFVPSLSALFLFVPCFNSPLLLNCAAAVSQTVSSPRISRVIILAWWAAQSMTLGAIRPFPGPGREVPSPHT